MLYKENNYFPVIVIAVFLVIGIAWTAYDIIRSQPEPQTSSISNTLEDRCTFVMKTSGTPFTISENSAGEYNYELYMRNDGYIEVWSCPPAVVK